MNSVVITGTGTDVGKTFVTAGMLRALRRTGCDAVMQKPFQTGCNRRTDGTLDHPDLDTVAAAAGWCPETSEMPDLCPYAYEPACSPHLAARLAGEDPSVARVVQAARRLAVRHACVLAETAGGILVPINAREVMLDWMAELGWPVVVVARARLGTINETLLTLRALRAAGLECAGVVLNETGPVVADADDAYIRRDNVEAIRAYGRVPVLATLGFLGRELKAIPWDRFEAAFEPPIGSLFGGL